MKVLKELQDSRYKLLLFEWRGDKFLYLEDREQGSESLCLVEGEVPLEELWEKHLKEENFCLPCRLLLYFDKKVLKWENSVAELGLTLERLEKFKEVLNDNR
ncbi:hypothetical protein [Thermovibrio sp.]